jgi:hypothetical protein
METQKPPCKQLRTRMYDIVGRDHKDLVEQASNAQYWCALTTTVLGPDEVYCSPRVCTERRSCFEPE